MFRERFEAGTEEDAMLDVSGNGTADIPSSRDVHGFDLSDMRRGWIDDTAWSEMRGM